MMIEGRQALVDVSVPVKEFVVQTVIRVVGIDLFDAFADACQCALGILEPTQPNHSEQRRPE
jgi:hypothetical protein